VQAPSFALVLVSIFLQTLFPYFFPRASQCEKFVQVKSSLVIFSQFARQFAPRESMSFAVFVNFVFILSRRTTSISFQSCFALSENVYFTHNVNIRKYYVDSSHYLLHWTMLSSIVCKKKDSVFVLNRSDISVELRNKMYFCCYSGQTPIQWSTCMCYVQFDHEYLSTQSHWTKPRQR